MPYTRPTLTTQRFVHTAKNKGKFYILRTDLHNRRITIQFGKLGTEGQTRVFEFETRDEAREFEDHLLERRYTNGYVRMAA